MGYFTDVLATSLDVDRVNYIAIWEGQRALRMHQKYLNLCSEDERSVLRVWNDMRVSN